MPASASPTTTKKRVLDIEAALQWAYQSELPKRREDRAITAPLPAQVHPMWRAGAFGGRIDCWNRDPGFPLAMGDPSPDALRIEAAVEALDDSTLDITPYDIGKGLGEHVDMRHVVSIKAVYDARKLYEAERVETKAHAHNRAQRYVEKRFLRDLWCRWRVSDG